jgi:hypothetical protein
MPNPRPQPEAREVDRVEAVANSHESDQNDDFL